MRICILMILIRQFCSISKIQQELIAKASETLSDSNTMDSNYEVAFFLLFKNGGFSLLSLLYCFSHQNMILVLLCYLSKWRMVGEIKEKLKQLKMKFLSYFVRFYYIFAWHITPYIKSGCANSCYSQQEVKKIPQGPLILSELDM